MRKPPKKVKKAWSKMFDAVMEFQSECLRNGMPPSFILAQIISVFYARFEEKLNAEERRNFLVNASNMALQQIEESLQ